MLVRLVNRHGWQRWEDIDPAREVYAHREYDGDDVSFASYATHDIPRAMPVRETLFARADFRFPDGTREVVYFEQGIEQQIPIEPVRTEGETRARKQATRSRKLCAAAAMFLRRAGELALARAIADGELTEDDAANRVAQLGARLTNEARMLTEEERNEVWQEFGHVYEWPRIAR